MSSGSRGPRGVVSNNSKNMNHTSKSASEDAGTKTTKAAPTAEQIRLAQITDNSHTQHIDNEMEKKIEQVRSMEGISYVD